MKMAISRKKLFRRVALLLVISFISMNIVAFFHAWKFTHFSETVESKTSDPQKLSGWEKIKTLVLGVNNPRPMNDSVPKQAFEVIKLKGGKEVECWRIKTDSALGTVVLFHGFAGQKASLLDKAEEFLTMGYNVLLADFMGSGGSEGNQTTIGYFEAEQVKRCYDYLVQQGEKRIFLFGTSMGAVAIMKAIKDYQLSPNGIVIECPFGSMYKTVAARFRTMNAPAFPMAHLLVFWGGIQNGFWAFGHNPVSYAKRIGCPVLLLYGERDEKVSRQEIDEIYANLQGPRQLVTYPLAAHENFLVKYRQEWMTDVKHFLTVY